MASAPPVFKTSQLSGSRGTTRERNSFAACASRSPFVVADRRSAWVAEGHRGATLKDCP